MHELASCFCPYQLYPYDPLCTYGLKQFGFWNFLNMAPSGAPQENFPAPVTDHLGLPAANRHGLHRVAGRAAEIAFFSALVQTDFCFPRRKKCDEPLLHACPSFFPAPRRITV